MITKSTGIDINNKIRNKKYHTRTVLKSNGKFVETETKTRGSQEPVSFTWL